MIRYFGVVICLALLLAVAAAGEELTVSGRVKVSGNPATTQPSQLEGVVAWLTPVGGSPAKFVPHERLRLTQHNKSFEPHVLIVPVGAVVEFPNRDPFFHNVFSLFEGKRFDLGLYEAGTTRNVSFDRVGISYIFCNIHAEMSAVVIALDTPYYGISDKKGEIAIPDVPSGDYVLKVWAETDLPENLNALTRQVKISGSNTTLGVLEINPGLASTAHKNKFGMDYEPASPDSPGYSRP